MRLTHYFSTVLIHLLLTVFLPWIAIVPCGAQDRVIWPGLEPNGSVLLPNQWSLRPAGNSVQLGDFPVNIAVHPGSQYAAILHCGYGQHEIVVVDLSSAQLVSRTPIEEAFYGLEFSPDGRRLYASGAGEEVVHEFEFTEGNLTQAKDIPLRDSSFRGVPAGLAIDSKGQTLFVANLLNSLVTRVDLSSGELVAFPLRPDAVTSNRVPVSPSADSDTAAAEKRAEASLYPNDSEAQYPYDCAYDAGNQRLYVSLWNQGCVAVINSDSGAVLGRWGAGQHPSEMALRRDGRYLFVSNGNDNTVTVFDTKDGRVVETLWGTLFPGLSSGSYSKQPVPFRRRGLALRCQCEHQCGCRFQCRAPGEESESRFHSDRLVSNLCSCDSGRQEVVDCQRERAGTQGKPGRTTAGSQQLEC